MYPRTFYNSKHLPGEYCCFGGGDLVLILFLKVFTFFPLSLDLCRENRRCFAEEEVDSDDESEFDELK